MKIDMAIKNYLESLDYNAIFLFFDYIFLLTCKIIYWYGLADVTKLKTCAHFVEKDLQFFH